MRPLGSWLLLIAAFTAEGLAQESSLNRPGSGARAAGMGNAFIAVSDDGTAASWNPAGLSQLRRPEFSLVYSVARRNQFREGYRTLDRTALFTNLRSSSGSADLEFASAALPFTVADRPVTLQLGWRRLYQIDGRLQGDVRRVPVATVGRPESLLRFDNSADGSVDLWSLAGAVRITNRLSLGMSADFYRGAWGEQVNVNENPGYFGPTDFLSTTTARRIGGHSIGVGLLLAFPSFRTGLVYHGTLESGLEIATSLRSNLTTAVDQRIGPSQGSRLHFPNSLGLGIAWLPRPLLRFAVDLTYDEWTKFLVEGTPGSPYQAVSGFDDLPPELTATRNTITVNAGMERLVPVGERYVPLRLGITREPQGGRDPFFRGNAVQNVVSGGSGLNSNSLKFDVSLEYRWGAFRNAGSLSPVYGVGAAEMVGLPLPPEAEGTVRFQDWRLKASVIYRIANPDKIKDFLRKTLGT